MKPTNHLLEHASKQPPHPRGFALIVTLSLMILLTVIAVGLLSLSSISLRTSSQGEAMSSARANARLSLMLAIGDLQKQLGPDTRISATADQVAAANSPLVSTSLIHGIASCRPISDVPVNRPAFQMPRTTRLSYGQT